MSPTDPTRSDEQDTGHPTPQGSSPVPASPTPPPQPGMQPAPHDAPIPPPSELRTASQPAAAAEDQPAPGTDTPRAAETHADATATTREPDPAAFQTAAHGPHLQPYVPAPSHEAPVGAPAAEAAPQHTHGSGAQGAPAPTHQMEKPAAASADPAAEPAPVLAGLQRPADPEDADDVLQRKLPGREAADAAVLARSRRHTRRSFLVAAVAAAAGIGAYEYMESGPQQQMQPDAMRAAFNLNARLSEGLFRSHALAPTYPLSRAETLRINGVVGLNKTLVPESWRLQLVGARAAATHPRYTRDVTAWEYRYTAADPGADKGHDTKVDPKLQKAPIQTADKMAPAGMVEQAEEDENGSGRPPRGMGEAGESDSTLAPHTPGLLLTLADVLRLPRHELVTQFTCIEGWSQIVHWAGVRMADFLEAYPPEPIDGRPPRYIYMETPDGDYYTGFDLAVMRQPQALLVTEMMGAPLAQFHGAPLRLHMPTKYGYKQIKRIGLIAYTNDKPDDYWTKLGYDWYAGL